jgi:putative FmdB family regulatory protein
MPIYEYKCDRCGEVFEVRQKFSDQPLTAHEKCGGAVERVISAPAFQFKGSGWYVTDYAKGGNGSKKSETEAKPATETKTESKPAESKGESSGKAKSDS